MGKLIKQNIYLIVLSILGVACQNSNKSHLVFRQYDGPMVETIGVTNIWSDSARVKVKLTAPTELIYSSGDKEYPHGLSIIFYEADGTPSATLRADYCYSIDKEKLWKLYGGVEAKSVQKKMELTTEEIFWSERDKKIYNDKFTRIEDDGFLLMGEGLEASQDFSTYFFIKSHGDIDLGRHQTQDDNQE